MFGVMEMSCSILPLIPVPQTLLVVPSCLGSATPGLLSQPCYQPQAVQNHKLWVLSQILLNIHIYHVSETLKS